MRCGTTRIGRTLAVLGLLLAIALCAPRVARADDPGTCTFVPSTPNNANCVPVTPRLDCVQPIPPDANGDTYRAYFGYVNVNVDTVLTMIGSNNLILQGDSLDHGQPTFFASGDHYNVFSVAYDPGQGLYWELDGVYADASDVADAPRCATGVFATAEQFSLAAPVGGSAVDTIVVSNPAPPGQTPGGPSALVVGPPTGLSAPLSVSPTTGFTVPAPPSTATQTLTITCSPADTSTSTQTLTIATSDIARPTVTYAIACTGYVPAGGGGGGGGTGGTTPELPSGGLLGVGMVAVVLARRWLRRRAILA